MDGVIAIFWLIGLVVNITCAVICYQKGKPNFCWIGGLFCGVFGWVGAIRLAKPGSRWFMKYVHSNDQWKVQESLRRFPREAFYWKEASSPTPELHVRRPEPSSNTLAFPINPR